MFSLIKQVFIALLSFSESLARNRAKCLDLNDDPCMVINPVELKYYPFMISLDKYTGSYNIYRTYIQNIFHVTVNATAIVQHVFQNKNGIIKHVNVNVKVTVSAKEIIVGIQAYVFLRIVSI